MSRVDGRMYSLAISDARQLLDYLEREGGEGAGDAGRVHLLLARALSLRAQEQRPDAGSGSIGEPLDSFMFCTRSESPGVPGAFSLCRSARPAAATP